MKLLLFAGSLREQSINHKLVLQSAELLKSAGIEIDVARMSEFELPLYNSDIDTPEQRPAGLDNFMRRFEAADGLIIASPEYNYSIPGPLKNLIDWVSRVRPMPWRGSKIMIMSASPSMMGGIRGLWQLRVPLEGCGAFVHPTMFALTNASNELSGDARLTDKKRVEQLQQTLMDFVEFTRKLKG